MNKKDEFAINWMNNPEKDVVKEPEVAEKKVSEKIKKKLKEEEEQKKRDAEIKAKEKERLAKNTPVSGLSFANVRTIGQERVDEKARKDREAHDEGERRKAKAIAEETVSAGLLVNSEKLKAVIEEQIGKYNVDVKLMAADRTGDHNYIEQHTFGVDMHLYSGGWNSDYGVWSIPRVAEYARESLINAGFKVSDVETHSGNCYSKNSYSFKIDLTSMFKAK